MNGLPSLPTDNLYKFCAITGVVIVTLVAYSTWTRKDDPQRRIIAVRFELSKEKIESDYLQILAKANITESQQRPNSAESLEELKGVAAKHFERDRDLKMKMEEINAATSGVELSASDLSRVTWCGYGG